MSKKKLENVHCVTFALKGLTPAQKRSLEKQFYYTWKYKNEYIEYVWKHIYEIAEIDNELKEILEKLDVAKKLDGKSVTKNDESQSLYTIKNALREKNKYYDFVGSKTQTAFNQQVDGKYQIFTGDEGRGGALRDVRIAFEEFFNGTRGKPKTNSFENFLSIYVKPPISATGRENSSSAKFRWCNNKCYIQIKDLNKYALKCAFEKYDTETHKLKYIIRHRYFWAELFCNKKDVLQKQLYNPELYIGARKFIRMRKNGKWVYCVQLNYEVTSPIVTDIKNENFKIAINGQTETIAYCRMDGEQGIIELSPDTPRYVPELQALNRYMDNSRRATNPDMFNEDGTIKYSRHQMRELGLEFKKSNRYKKAVVKYAELYRCLRNKRKTNNQILAKKLFSMGNEFVLDNNQYKAWGMKRCRMSKKSKEKYDNGIRMNDYTKQIHDRACASAITRIQQLSNQLGFNCNKIIGFNSSTYNHLTQQFDIFLKLNQRLVVFDDSDCDDYAYNFTDTFCYIEDGLGNKYMVQRDIYAASKLLFCIHSKEKIKNEKTGKYYERDVWTFDQDGYTKFFNDVFYPKHKEYLEKLIGDMKLGAKINGTILGN